MPTTTAHGVCRPEPGLTHGAQGSRALVPAKHVVNGAAGKLNLAPWPRYRSTCCVGDQAVPLLADTGGLSNNATHTRGAPATLPLPDLSYPGNHLTDIDNFFITDTPRPCGSVHAPHPPTHTHTHTSPLACA